MESKGPSQTMKLLLVAGARPNFVKIAPLIRAIRAYKAPAVPESRFDYTLVHTGQHYDEQMSKVFFDQMGIPTPDFNLEVGSGSHAVQTAKVMTAFEPVLLKVNPDWVVVVGDVNSTMACTLVAAKLGKKVAHVEAGLRSFDRGMPEEINRLVTDALADLLLTPSLDANENLRKEGVADSKIRLVGNIMIDALVENLEQARQSQILKRLGIRPKEFAYVTLHRPSNVDAPGSLKQIMNELQNITQQMPVIFPIHPRTRKMLSDSGLTPDGSSKLQLLDPVGYHDSLALTQNARMVLTDSGGLQEETTYFRTPCLTLRPNTERPVTITVGTNRLTTPARLAEDVRRTLGESVPKGEIPPLWDGKTAERILAALLEVTAQS